MQLDDVKHETLALITLLNSLKEVQNLSKMLVNYLSFCLYFLQKDPLKFFQKPIELWIFKVKN